MTNEEIEKLIESYNLELKEIDERLQKIFYEDIMILNEESKQLLEKRKEITNQIKILQKDNWEYGVGHIDTFLYDYILGGEVYETLFIISSGTS